MAIVGIDGKPIASEEFEYFIDEFGFKTTATPEDAYRKAQADTQRDFPTGALPIGVAHPFAREPAAHALFMGMSNELKRLRARLDKLESALEPEDKP